MKNRWSSYSRRRKLTSAVLAVLALVAASVALAAWLTSGTGPGSGQNAELADLTVEESTVPSAKLCAAGAACNVVVKVTNPASNPALTVTKWAHGLLGSQGITTSNATACPPSNYSRPKSGAPFSPTLPIASGESLDVQLVDAVTLATDAPDGCQGVTFTVDAIQVTASTG